MYVGVRFPINGTATTYGGVVSVKYFAFLFLNQLIGTLDGEINHHRNYYTQLAMATSIRQAMHCGCDCVFNRSAESVLSF